MQPIVVSALALIRDRRLLMVTARERDVLYLPGGKLEPGESPVAALIRESREEVAVRLDPATVVELFTVRTQAHGEPDGQEVHMTLFAAEPADDSPEPRASSEVGELHWVTSADAVRCPPAGVATLQGLRDRGLID
ncbi:NUDIX hydrolase [Frigoribacterium faeni]|uniref:8-oxo-dGTP pyrophosphatase MutT (NUDIX family) n=1 Tax=Frigoribacterium faeni TaxID=145483 RepID=A0A7W3PKF5_9MICO|nr:NUDIX domain-containing protein [Frigoribacterium faeni]MBA8814784.1 8-oxo-dGTP pyrophosphatase MutT (NUDIX family) [Frigoribacterium faeni]BFF15735.1 NUDIX domain-containing protein [Microbacterium flavescens]GEK83575.1 DNA mismatch repair protein MutT [Frigoribacterium faeni]